MSNHLEISIPKPCHEKWNGFEKTKQGGYCQSCQKEVIDFTSWSDDRIKLYFKNINGNTCGRFREDQLRVYAFDPVNANRNRWLPMIFTGGLLLLLSRQTMGQQRHDFAHHPTELNGMMS